MKKNTRISFRVDRTQHERLKNNATAKGYLTISDYLRNISLDKDLHWEKKIYEIHSLLLDISNKIKKNEFLGANHQDSRRVY